MNKFIDEYIEKLKNINNDEDLKNIYFWLWEKQNEITESALEINKSLELKGEYELKTDLPCITVGGRQGLLILSANPGWTEKYNKKENEYCKTSPDKYVDLMFNFFEKHPNVVGISSRWWSNAMSMVEILDGHRNFFKGLNREKKWGKVHETKMVGGWELFPFHSSKDGISSKIDDHNWLKICAIESINAAIRLSPKVLFIASKQGYKLVRNVLCSDLTGWKDGVVSREGDKAALSLYENQNGTEIIAISRQIFTAPRKFTNIDIINGVAALRMR